MPVVAAHAGSITVRVGMEHSCMGHSYRAWRIGKMGDRSYSYSQWFYPILHRVDSNYGFVEGRITNLRNLIFNFNLIFKVPK